MKINVYIKNIKFKRDLNPFQKKKYDLHSLESK